MESCVCVEVYLFNDGNHVTWYSLMESLCSYFVRSVRLLHYDGLVKQSSVLAAVFCNGIIV